MWWDKEDLSPESLEPIKRIWHRHEKWEEVDAGMWRQVTGKTRSFMLENAIDFTGDHELYGYFMVKVVELWKFSCEHSLSCLCMNRKAWIGHAACCLAIGVPEDITREAWKFLSNRQRKLANFKAEQAIALWEKNNAKDATRDECSRRRKRADFSSFRFVQQNLFEFFRRERQHGNASPCHG